MMDRDRDRQPLARAALSRRWVDGLLGRTSETTTGVRELIDSAVAYVDSARARGSRFVFRAGPLGAIPIELAPLCGQAVAMAQSLQMPPPGFDDLPVEEKIEYVQSLWDRIAVSVGELPLADWQREILDQRLAAHRASPDEARPWGETLDDLERRLKARLSSQ